MQVSRNIFLFVLKNYLFIAHLRSISNSWYAFS